MTPEVELPSGIHEERGLIQVLIHEHKGSVVVIDTVPKVQRANHYHKDDYHYAYIVKGSIVYYERPVGSRLIPTKYKFKAGQMFYTGPMIEHSMYFDEPTVFIAMGGKTRTREEYEEDLVRLPSLHDEYLERSSQPT